MKLFCLLLVFFITSCSTVSHKSLLQMKYVGKMEWATGKTFKEIPIGGISGIVYDKKLGEFWAISDDRSFFDHARMFRFKIISLSPLKLIMTKVIYLRDEKRKYYRKGHVDFEGIALLPNGNILLSSESIEEKKFSYPPRLMEFNRSGFFIKNWAVDDKYFRAEGKGVRRNKSFESLVTDNNFVYTAVENALLQDDKDLTAKHGQKIRILRFKQGKGGYSPCAEYIYHLSPLPVQNIGDKGDSGLVELLVWSPSTLLALERSYLYRQHMNVIKLFQFNLGKNIKNYFSLSKLNYSIEKRLVLDFADLQIKLDNIEGMAWGPIMPNGHRSILFVSDNNFNKKQTTLFLLFEVVP